MHFFGVISSVFRNNGRCIFRDLGFWQINYLLALFRSWIKSPDSFCLISEVWMTLSNVLNKFSMRCLSKSSVLLQSFLWLELLLTCSCRWWICVRSMVSTDRFSCKLKSKPGKENDFWLKKRLHFFNRLIWNFTSLFLITDVYFRLQIGHFLFGSH